MSEDLERAIAKIAKRSQRGPVPYSEIKRICGDNYGVALDALDAMLSAGTLKRRKRRVAGGDGIEHEVTEFVRP